MILGHIMLLIYLNQDFRDSGAAAGANGSGSAGAGAAGAAGANGFIAAAPSGFTLV